MIAGPSIYQDAGRRSDKTVVGHDEIGHARCHADANCNIQEVIANHSNGGTGIDIDSVDGCASADPATGDH
jgi:hypothetical protein